MYMRVPFWSPHTNEKNLSIQTSYRQNHGLHMLVEFATETKALFSDVNESIFRL